MWSFSFKLLKQCFWFACVLDIAMSFAVWLHGFYDGTRQSAVNCASLPSHAGSRQRLWLPKPDWFVSCLEVNKINNPAHRWEGSEAPSRPLIRALALVKAGKVWESVLTPLTDEELLGFDFFGYATDFYSLEVQAVMTAEEPFLLSEAQTYRYVRGQDGVARLKGQDFTVTSSVLTVPFHPYTPGLAIGDIKLRHPNGSQVTLTEALSEWRLSMSDCKLVVPILFPLLDLICRGAWRFIPCLGRWLNLLSQLPERVQSKIGNLGADPPSPQDGQISRGKILHLIRQLQAWWCQLSQHDNAEEEEARVEFQGAISWLRNVMAALPGDHGTNLIRSKNAYTSLFLVKSMLMTRLLPAYVSTKQLCIDAVLALFPHLLAEPVAQILKQKHVFPSKGSKHAMRLILDVSLMLWRGKREETCDFVRFGGADSSPQLGSNWLLSSCYYIEKTQIIDTFHSIQRMILDCQNRAALKGKWEQDDVSVKDHNQLCMRLRKEHHIPVAMGNAAESTGNKCAALLHKWCLCVRQISTLQKYRDSFMSFCSDMGTELGIGEFRVDNVESLMPSWLLPSDLQTDLAAGYIQPEAGSDFELLPDLALPAEPAQEQVSVQAMDSEGPRPSEGCGQNQNLDRSAFFLQNAVVIPGILHIVNNALEQVSTSMSYWDSWFEQLQQFEGLWQCGRLQRFINYCVRTSDLSHKAHDLLRQKLGSLYMKRWGEISKFCQRLNNVLWVIRCTWNERNFLQGVTSQAGDKDASANFSPQKFSLVLKDHLFFCYFDLVLNLTKVLEACGQWAECCPCHEDLQAPQFGPECGSQRSANLSVRTLFSFQADVCPMRGKRLPELVAGGMQAVLEHLAAMAFTDLLQKHRPLLTAEQWAMVVQDFDTAKSHAALEFQLKFDWAQRLPWKLALLGHLDQSLARRELQVVVSQFDSQSPELQQHHHRLTYQLLSTSSPLRADLNRFLSGKALHELPRLEHFAACFRFMQITERSYEAAHSIVKRRAPPNAKGPTISLTLRLLDLAGDVKLEPKILMEVADEFDRARNVKQIPHVLGIATHPALAPLLTLKRNRWKLIQKLNHVLYRTDPLSQFPDLTHVDHWHSVAKERAKRAGEKLSKLKDQRNLTYSALRAEALFKHFLSIASNCSDLVFSFPKDILDKPVTHGDVQPPALVDLQDALTMTAQVPENLPLLPDLETSENLGCTSLLPANEGQIEASRDGGAAGSKQIFIKVVSTRPSSRRTMTLSPAAAGISGRLKVSDIAVTVHDCITIDRSVSSWVSVTPSVDHTPLSIQILSRFPEALSYESMSSNLFLHPPAKSSNLLYTIPGAENNELSKKFLAETVSALVEHAAIPGSEQWLPLGQSAELLVLQTAGFILSSHRGFQLSQQGLEKLQMCRQYSTSKPVVAVTLDSLSLPSPSEHELIQALEDSGWVWERLPRKRARGSDVLAPFVYEVGGEKIWRTAGFTIHREYLQCLLAANGLKEQYGILRIPHGASATIYAKLLKGTVTEPHPKQELHLQDDLATEVEIELSRSHAQEQADDVPDSAEELGVILDSEDFQLDCLDVDMDFFCASNGAHSPILDSPAAPAVIDLASMPAAPEPGAVDAGAHASLPPLLQDEIEAHNPSSSSGGTHSHPEPRRFQGDKAEIPTAPTLDMKAFKYGAFHFTKKIAKNNSVSWEASCPFHRKNQLTGCKHSKVVKPVTESQSAAVILQLKHWCNMALSFTRQRDHLAFSASPDEIPPEALVNASCIPRSQVDGNVKTDVDLDLEAGLSAPSKPQRAAAKAGAKQKTSKVNPTRTEGTRAKPKIAPADRPRKSGGSGSSSTSSSSGSSRNEESGSSSDSSSSSGSSKSS